MLTRSLLICIAVVEGESVIKAMGSPAMRMDLVGILVILPADQGDSAAARQEGDSVGMVDSVRQLVDLSVRAVGMTAGMQNGHATENPKQMLTAEEDLRERMRIFGFTFLSDSSADLAGVS